MKTNSSLATLILFSAIQILISNFAYGIEAKEKATTKGILPEIKLTGKNEETDQAKAAQTEALITKTENEAIESLKKIISRRQGTADEPQLWYRLAELYMRRSKSGRFFDLYRNSESTVQLIAPAVREQSAKKYLTEAIKIYQKIETSWPKFLDYDSVLFNEAFAHQQLGQGSVAKKQYLHLVQEFPNSALRPDAELALGEMLYNDHQFEEALNHFKMIEKYPNAKVYSYGVYKAAWSYYNLKDNEHAIAQMIKLLDISKKQTQHNLKSEGLRDLVLFFSDSRPANEAYSFFSKICSEQELGETLIILAKIHKSHSRDKELIVFASEYLSNQNKIIPVPNVEIEMRIILTTAYETLKNRDQVVQELKTLSEQCKNQHTENCDINYPRLAVELAKKWWELWQKNKPDKNLAKLTMQAFELRLSTEDTSKPDLKTRYAFAELLYQLEDYNAASEQYEIVSDKTVETSVIHDASYSSLVAYEKYSKHTQERLIQLAQKYIQKNPNGKYVEQIRFKIGFTYYEVKNYPEAEKYLLALATQKQASEFKLKSEDLVLDILNAKKDYKQIKEFALKLSTTATSETRKNELIKISQEAYFAEIQEVAKGDDKKKAAQLLLGFYNEHPNSAQAQLALWQSLSLNFSSGKKLEAADTALQYSKNYSNDQKSIDALKEAAQSYLSYGYIEKSAQVLEMLIHKTSGDTQRHYIDAAYELYITLGDNKKAKALIPPGLEPYTSIALVEKAEQLLENQKWNEAYQATKNLINNKTPQDVKARANLVRANVLEHELTSQSVKTTLDRMTQVLGIKTEKLEKAQEAYILASKLSENEEFKRKSALGLQRCYQNYIQSIENMIVKNDLSVEERKALDNELQKIISPIKIKHEEITAKIASAPISTTAQNSTANNDSKLESIYPNGIELSLRYKFDKKDSCKSNELKNSKEQSELIKAISKCFINKPSGTQSVQYIHDIENAIEKLDRDYPENNYGLMFKATLAADLKQTKKAKLLYELLVKSGKLDVIGRVAGGEQ